MMDRCKEMKGTGHYTDPVACSGLAPCFLLTWTSERWSVDVEIIIIFNPRHNLDRDTFKYGLNTRTLSRREHPHKERHVNPENRLQNGKGFRTRSQTFLQPKHDETL